MIITKAISTKLRASRHVFLRQFYTEIQKKKTYSEVVDTKSQTDRTRQTDGRTDFVCGKGVVLFYLVKLIGF